VDVLDLTEDACVHEVLALLLLDTGVVSLSFVRLVSPVPCDSDPRFISTELDLSEAELGFPFVLGIEGESSPALDDLLVGLPCFTRQDAVTSFNSGGTTTVYFGAPG